MKTAGVIPRRLSVSKNYVFDTLSNETHFVGLSFEGMRPAAAHSMCAYGAHFARLRAEKCFSRGTRPREKQIELYLRLRAQTLRGFFDRLNPASK